MFIVPTGLNRFVLTNMIHLTTAIFLEKGKIPMKFQKIAELQKIFYYLLSPVAQILP